MVMHKHDLVYIPVSGRWIKDSRIHRQNITRVPPSQLYFDAMIDVFFLQICV